LNRQNNVRPWETNSVLQLLTGLIGTTVTISAKTGQKYEGVIISTSGEGDTAVVTLKNVKDISVPGARLKDFIFLALTDIDTWASGPANTKAVNGNSFKTDTNIRNKPGFRRKRELAAWTSDTPSTTPNMTFGTHGDDISFGPGASNGGWDQFATNEKLFGVKTSFDEEVYTTKPGWSGPDFKERERKAQQIANEIMGLGTSNAHVHKESTVDNVSLGPGASNGGWDQFAINERLFGVKTSFDEEVYTTKLSRNGLNFKERERKALQIANGIMGSATNNTHVRKERPTDNADENGAGEKYAGVVRGANAYIPPGARKAGVIEEAPTLDIPNVNLQS